MPIHLHDTLPSTSDEARRLAETGAPHGTAVCARVQTAGRGRYDRAWQSPAGNLHVSVLLRPTVPAARLPEIAFVAGLAVSDAVRAFLPAASVMLKWPNDVLVGGAKAAGILLEAGGDGGNTWVIVGAGLNVAWSPPDLPYPATSLASEGASCAAIDDVLPTLLAALDDRFARWEADGFAPIRAEWLRRAHPIGHPVRVRQGNLDVSGAFAGLGEDGSLLVHADGGIRRFVAGDVSVGG